MADDTRLRLIREELQRRQAEKRMPPESVTSSAPGGAFIATDPAQEDLPEMFAEPQEPGLVPTLIKKAPALIAGAKAAEKSYEFGHKTAETVFPFWPVPEAAGAVSAIAGGSAAAAGVELTSQEIKRRLGLPGNILGSESDSFSESFAHALGAGLDVGLAETWSQIGDPILRGVMVPYKPQMTPEDMAVMAEMQGRLRGVYEKITGRPADEINWVPGRINQTPEGAVDKTTAAQRLRASGYDAREARIIAMGNPQTMAEATDKSLYRLFQGWAANATVGRNIMDRFRGTRAKMMTQAVSDLGDVYGKSLPIERLGEGISNAIDGRYDLLYGARKTLINGINNALGEGFIMKGKELRQGFRALGGTPIQEMVGALGDSPSFAQVQQVRENLGIMMHDMSLPETTRAATQAEAAAAAKVLDERIAAQLPGGVGKEYARWSGVDRDFNQLQFNSDFVKSLLHQKGGYYQYAAKILKDGNADNYMALETALGKDSPEIQNVKAALWQRVAKGSTERNAEVMRPDMMRIQLQENGRYGRAFLETVFGKDTVQSYENLARGMEILNQRMKESGNYRIGLGKLATTLGYGEGLRTFLGNGVTAHGAELLAAIIGSPYVMGHVLTNPHAADLMDKLVTSVANRAGPGRISRLTSYVAEAMGMRPEEILASSGMAGTEGLRELRGQLEEGQLPWWKRAGKEIVSSLQPMGLGGEGPPTMMR